MKEKRYRAVLAAAPLLPDAQVVIAGETLHPGNNAT